MSYLPTYYFVLSNESPCSAVNWTESDERGNRYFGKFTFKLAGLEVKTSSCQKIALLIIIIIIIIIVNQDHYNHDDMILIMMMI